MGGSKPRPPSLCWDCANACTRGCSWADTFTPVDGWIAARHDLHVMSGGVDRPYESTSSSSVLCLSWTHGWEARGGWMIRHTNGKLSFKDGF